MGGGDVIVEEPEPTAEEVKILEILLSNLEEKQALKESNKGIFQDFLSSNPLTGELTEDELTKLDEIEQAFLKPKLQAIDDEAEKASTLLKQKLSKSGLSDSTVFADKFAKLSEFATEAKDKAGSEAFLFKTAAEDDIKNAALQEQLSKIGVLTTATDLSQAGPLLASLGQQRSEQSQKLLQAALISAQNQGGFLGPLGTFLGGGLGLLFGGPAGAAAGGFIGSAGGSTLQGVF